MNKAQEKAVARFRETVDKWCGDRYEIKEWDVHSIDVNGIYSLLVATGLPGDEGTLAASLARDRAHIFIGPRGGVSYYVYRNGKYICRDDSCPTFLHIACEQNKDMEHYRKKAQKAANGPSSISG